MNMLDRQIEETHDGEGGGRLRRIVAIGGTVLVAASAVVVGVALFTSDREGDAGRRPGVLPAAIERQGSGDGAAAGALPGVMAPRAGSIATLPEAVPVGPPPLGHGETDYRRGESLYLAGDYAGATLHLHAEAGLHPDRFYPSYLLGLSLGRQRRHDEAIAALQNATRIDSASVKALTNLGRVLNDAGRHDEALAAATAASERDPRSADAWNVRGRALLGLGRRDEAIGAFETATGIDPGNAWAPNNLGYALLGAGRFGEAIAPLEKAVTLRPGIGVFDNNLGMAYERTGRYGEALQAYRRAVDNGGGLRAERNRDRLEAATDLVRGSFTPDSDPEIAPGPGEESPVTTDTAPGLLDEPGGLY